jgi:hypothetical protein
LLDDLSRLRRRDWPPGDERLGPTRFHPDAPGGGRGRQLDAAACPARVDIRTTPVCTHAEIVDRLRNELNAEVIVVADHLIPCAIADDTPADRHRLCRCRRPANPTHRTRPAIGVRCYAPHPPAIKLGPGDPPGRIAPTNASPRWNCTGHAGYTAIARAFCGK